MFGEGSRFRSLLGASSRMSPLFATGLALISLLAASSRINSLFGTGSALEAGFDSKQIMSQCFRGLKSLMWALVLIAVAGCAGSAGRNVENSYPSVRYFKSTYPGVALCVEGNCSNGIGTLLSLAYRGYSYRPHQTNDTFHATIYDGQFSQGGKIFNGDVHYFIRTGHTGVRNSDGTQIYHMHFGLHVPSAVKGRKGLVYTGEMQAMAESKAGYGEKFHQYFPTKKGGQLFAKESVKNIESMFVKGLDGHLLIANIKYKSNHPAFKEFYGLARFEDLATSNYITPSLGEMILKNGDTYVGGFWKDSFQGPGRLTEMTSGSARNFEGVFSRGQLVRPAKLGIDSDFKNIFDRGELISSSQFGFKTMQAAPKFLFDSYGKNEHVNPSLYWGPLQVSEENFGLLISSSQKHYFEKEDRNFSYNRYHFYKNDYWVHSTAPFLHHMKSKGIVPAYLAHGFYEDIEVPITAADSSRTDRIDFRGCATLNYEGKTFFGNYPLGWRVSDKGDVYVRGKEDRYGPKHEAPLKIYKNAEYGLNLKRTYNKSLLGQKSIAGAYNATVNVAKNDDSICSTKLTQEKRLKYLDQLQASYLKAEKYNRQSMREGQANWLKQNEAKYQAERERKARLRPCPDCGGSGWHIGSRAIETRFAPTHTYRNGLKITERTTMTSTQKTVRMCNFCRGKGMLDKSIVEKYKK